MTLQPKASSTSNLFFASSISAPWPESYPRGRLIEEKERHLTLLFLGRKEEEEALDLAYKLKSDPPLGLTLGFVGKFDQCLFLPPRTPRCATWHMSPIGTMRNPLQALQERVASWCQERGIENQNRHSFNPHLTLARAPFDLRAWRKSFRPLPFFSSELSLFQSLGHSHYKALHTIELKPPFVEIEHTADIGFWIYGHDLYDLYTHAKVALAFTFPEITPYCDREYPVGTIEELIRSLNRIVSEVDTDRGAPFKAVSLHTDMEEQAGLLKWEMIVDV